MYTKNYIELKEVGNAEVVKAGGGFAFATKKWDELTGEPVLPEIVAVDTVVLNQRKSELLKEIAAIDAVLADVVKLDGLSTPKVA